MIQSSIGAFLCFTKLYSLYIFRYVASCLFSSHQGIAGSYDIGGSVALLRKFLTEASIAFPSSFRLKEYLSIIAADKIVDKGLAMFCPAISGAEPRLDSSLYIRPFVIATDPYLGVRPSDTYKFIIILSPCGAYYPEGLNPVKIWVEDEYVRAVRGGIGYTKTGGNYVASMKAQEKAHEEGYSQVLWLDGIERKYIEEVGAMNIFFKLDGKVITPALSGSILPGVTRASVLELYREWGYQVEERKIDVEELYEAYKQGKLEEIWGTGTAAVISPVGVLKWKDNVMTINDGKIGELSQKLYDTVTGIQKGRIADTHSWTVEVK